MYIVAIVLLLYSGNVYTTPPEIIVGELQENLMEEPYQKLPMEEREENAYNDVLRMYELLDESPQYYEPKKVIYDEGKPQFGPKRNPYISK